jgi:hypothetical protein
VLNVLSIVCRMLSRRTLVSALVAVVVLGGAGAAGYRYWRHLQAAAPLPAPHTAVVLTAPTTPPPAATPTSTPAPTPLPPSVFVKVPYTSQFPFNQFTDRAHAEYCEAAALLMLSDYLKGDARARIPAAEADAGMGQIVGVERSTFPGVLDLPLTSVGAVGAQMFGMRPTVSPVDLNQIERNVADGRPVVIPVMTHGAGGPAIAPFYGSTNVYHVIVITGYDSARNLLYTNDAGFIQGQNYAYTWSTLSSAIDAQTQKIPQGRVMLVFDRA